MIDMYAAAIEPEEKDMTFIAVGPGSYTAGGKHVPSAAAGVPIRAAIQPMNLTTTGLIMKDMPEGVRYEAYFMLWTRAAVAIKIGDRVEYAGREYRVVHTWPWDADNFRKAGLGMLPA